MVVMMKMMIIKFLLCACAVLIVSDPQFHLIHVTFGI